MPSPSRRPNAGWRRSADQPKHLAGRITASVSERTWRCGVSPRIGISQAKEHLLRWFIDGNRFVSGCARDHSCRRDWWF